MCPWNNVVSKIDEQEFDGVHVLADVLDIIAFGLASERRSPQSAAALKKFPLRDFHNVERGEL